jgi:hypothetical protein
MKGIYLLFVFSQEMPHSEQASQLPRTYAKVQLCPEAMKIRKQFKNYDHHFAASSVMRISGTVEAP